MTYPWQEQQWRRLMDAGAGQRLPHALLLVGPRGTGVGQFARELAARLLCEADQKMQPACGQCHTCRWFKAGSHPDFRIITPEGAAEQIKIDMVRELINYLQLSSQEGKYKIAVMDPAEGMNRHAANALLKTLEEPPGDALLMLVSHQPSRLPATIRSRCQAVHFQRPERQAALDWLGGQVKDAGQAAALLDLAGGAPLAALAMEEAGALTRQQEILADLRELHRPHANPVKTAEKWQKLDAREVLNQLTLLFARMATAACAAPVGGQGAAAAGKELGELRSGLELSQMLSCYDLAQKNQQLLGGESNLNKQSLVEEVVVHWQELASGK